MHGSTDRSATTDTRSHVPFPIMSSSVESDSSAEEKTINGDEGRGIENGQDGASTPPALGNGVNRYKAMRRLGELSEDGSSDAVPHRALSPIDSLLSVPDDTPSIQVCSWLRPPFFGFTDLLRDLSFRPQMGVAYYPHSPLAEVSRARPPLFDPSIDASSLVFLAVSASLGHLHRPILRLVLVRSLSAASSCLILRTRTPHPRHGRLYGGQS